MIVSLSPPAEAMDPTYADWAAVLDGATDRRGVDYDLVAARRTALDRFLVDLAEAPVATWSRDEALSFWINSYNAITLAVVLDAGPALASIRDLDGGAVWTTRTFRVGGQALTLDAIEHTKIRPLGDPRAHAALVCAARSCPPLPSTPARADGLDTWLADAARAWVASTAWKDGSTVSLSPIFDWFGEDFRTTTDIPGVSGDLEAGLDFVATWTDPTTAARLRAGPPATFGSYDWSLNRR